jgi:hypothetical protein
MTVGDTPLNYHLTCSTDNYIPSVIFNCLGKTICQWCNLKLLINNVTKFNMPLAGYTIIILRKGQSDYLQ